MRRLWVLTKHTYLSYTRDQCTQLAAAISYFVLFSIVPLAIFMLSVFGFWLGNQDLRKDLVNHILDVVPLTQTDGRDAVEHSLDSVKRVSGPIAALSLIGTLWTASAVFSSIRKALNVVWGVPEHRPFARQKLVDFAQAGVMSVIFLSSLILTGVLRTVRQLSADRFGPLSSRNPLWELPPILLPAFLTLMTFAMLYRIVPAERPRWRDVLPGALFATILFEALKDSFAFYVANFNNYDVVYGSLGGVLLFLLYTFIGSNILLIGAETSHTLERYHHAEFADEISPAVPRPPMATLALRAVKGLFVRQ